MGVEALKIGLRSVEVGTGCLALLFELDDCFDEDLKFEGDSGLPLYVFGHRKNVRHFRYLAFDIGTCLSLDVTKPPRHDAEVGEYAES